MAALPFPAGIRPYRAGDTGYAQYMTAFNRNFGGLSGGGGNHNNGGGGLRLLQPAWSVDDEALRNKRAPASG